MIGVQTKPIKPTLWSTPYAAPGGSVHVVGDGGNFQTALNNAARGDIITLNAGSTYSGNFTLPDKGAGTDYIYIISSATLTPEGERVTTSDLTGFPKVVTPNVAAAIQAAPSASYYRFVNIDIKSSSTAVNGYLIGLGTGEETSAAVQPHHIIFDRCGVRGDPTNGGRRGVMFSGTYQAVIDSYLSDWKEVGSDTQAIAGWTGAGPYKIVNNYLEGAGENVMFGGSGTNGLVVTPSDIEIRGNHFFKPLTWKVGDPSYLGTHWSVKNILELKHAKRVLITDNDFENCWADSQTGFGILFTVINQTGSTPWATVNDVTFTFNRVHDMVGAMNLSAHDADGAVSDWSNRVLIYRNLFYDISDILFQVQHGFTDLHIDHNTAVHAGNFLVAAGGDRFQSRFRFTNNIVKNNLYGAIGDGQAPGNATLNTYFPGATFLKNAIVMEGSDGMDSSYYPANNFFPATMADVGFVNLTNNADLRLTRASAYYKAGLDGQDVGASLETTA